MNRLICAGLTNGRPCERDIPFTMETLTEALIANNWAGRNGNYYCPNHLGRDTIITEQYYHNVYLMAKGRKAVVATVKIKPEDLKGCHIIIYGGQAFTLANNQSSDTEYDWASCIDFDEINSRKGEYVVKR